MPGESPDFGALSTVLGVPLYGPQTIGAVSNAADTTLIDKADLSGFAGVQLSGSNPSNGNLKLFLFWWVDTAAGPVATAVETWSIGDRSNFTQGNVGWSKWFAAKGNKLSVTVRGQNTVSSDGALTIIPTTSVFPTTPGLLTPSEPGAAGVDMGIVAGLFQNVPGATTTTVRFNVPCWGPVSVGLLGPPPTGSGVFIQSFDYLDTLTATYALRVSDYPSAGLNLLLPAAAHHKLAFFNNSGAPVNPSLFVVGNV